jgi:hypothetical protein
MIMPKNNSLFSLSVLLVVFISLSGCVCLSPFEPAPTVVPTLTSTPAPSTTTAPPTIPPIKSLATGTQIVWELQGGYGQLVINNDVVGQDAVVILARADDPKDAVLAVYVKSGQDWTVEGVTDGQYVLYDMIGTNWDDANKRFEHTSEYARFNSTLNYYTTETESKVYTISLSGVGSGDTLSKRVEPEDMPPIG